MGPLLFLIVIEGALFSTLTPALLVLEARICFVVQLGNEVSVLMLFRLSTKASATCVGTIVIIVLRVSVSTLAWVPAEGAILVWASPGLPVVCSLVHPATLC